MAKINPNEMCPCESGHLFKDCHGLKVKSLSEPNISETFKLRVIREPDPDTRSVFIKEGDGTVLFKGNSVGLALICGSCESHLTVGIEKHTLKNLVLVCNNCGSYNEI